MIHIKYLGTFFYSTCILNELCMFSVRAFNNYLPIQTYFTLDAILASTNGVNKCYVLFYRLFIMALVSRFYLELLIFKYCNLFKKHQNSVHKKRLQNFLAILKCVKRAISNLLMHMNLHMYEHYSSTENQG